MRTITFICFDKGNSGDLACTSELMKILAVNPAYSDAVINLIYFSNKDPGPRLSEHVLRGGVALYVQSIPTFQKGWGYSHGTHHVDESTQMVTTCRELLTHSTAVVFFPRTPHEADDLCGWREVYNRLILEYAHKTLFVTEPTGVAHIQYGALSGEKGVHMGFSQLDSFCGMTYPDTSVPDQAHRSEIVTQLTKLKTEQKARVFFTYGHGERNHLTRFIMTVMKAAETISAHIPIFIIMLGYPDHIYKCFKSGDIQQQENLKLMIITELAKIQIRMGVSAKVEDATLDFFINPLINSRFLQETELSGNSFSTTQRFNFLPLQPVSAGEFLELMRLSDSIVGCTGTHSFATALALKKLPIYEYGRGQEYQQVMLIDVIHRLNDTQETKLRVAFEYILWLSCSLYGYCSEFAFSHIENAQHMFFQLASNPDELLRSPSYERLIRETDASQLFPKKLAQFICGLQPQQEMAQARPAGLFQLADKADSKLPPVTLKKDI